MAQPVGGGVDVGGAEDLALVHRQAAGQLAEVFVRQELGRQGLGLAEAAVGVQGPRPGRGLPQGLGVGRRPGQAVGGMLFGVEEVPVEPSLALHAPEDRGLQRRNQRAGLEGGGVQQIKEIGQDQGHGSTIGGLRCVRS